MFFRARLVHVYITLLFALTVGYASAQGTRQDILVAGKLAPKFDMGVNSSEGKTNWLRSEGDHLKLSYPPDQSWGAVFITVGKPKQQPRPFKDFSGFNTLTVEMKGGNGGEQIEIGIKTNAQADDGSETKVPLTLTPEWKTYSIALNRFEGTDLDKVYVACEFVFSGADAETIYVRNVSYSNSAK